MNARYFRLFVIGLAACGGASRPGSLPKSSSGGALPPVEPPSASASAVSPAAPNAAAPIIARISTSDPTCGVDTEGRVWRWQTGEMERDAESLQGAAAVECGMDHSCAILPNGVALCWGGNGYGALGDGTDTSTETPVRVAGLSSIAEMSLDYDRSCARSKEGDVFCWGDSEFGKAGDGRMPDNSGREKLLPGAAILKGASTLSVAGAHACSVMNDGKIWCWGQNNSGACGQPMRTRYVPRPKAVPNVKDAVAVATGESVTCMIDRPGAVSCWGANAYRVLGPHAPADGSPRDTPQAIPLPGRAVEVSVGDNGHACARLENGEVYCWGQGEDGELGDGSTDARATPVQARGIVHAKQITAGLEETCALVEGGRVFCWGKELKHEPGSNINGDDALVPLEMKLPPPGSD